MKAETALISVTRQGEEKKPQLKVMLIPETKQEADFLNDALEQAEGYQLSASIPKEWQRE